MGPVENELESLRTRRSHKRATPSSPPDASKNGSSGWTQQQRVVTMSFTYSVSMMCWASASQTTILLMPPVTRVVGDIQQQQFSEVPSDTSLGAGRCKDVRERRLTDVRDMGVRDAEDVSGNNSDDG
jgi:hypothetical protein